MKTQGENQQEFSERQEEDYRDRLREFFEFSGIGHSLPLPKGIEYWGEYIKYVIKKEVHANVQELEIICKAFPELNANWLLTGEGLMIRSVRANSVHEAVDTILDSNKGTVIVIDRMVGKINIEIPNLDSLNTVEDALQNLVLKAIQESEMERMGASMSQAKAGHL